MSKIDVDRSLLARRGRADRRRHGRRSQRRARDPPARDHRRPRRGERLRHRGDRGRREGQPVGRRASRTSPPRSRSTTPAWSPTCRVTSERLRSLTLPRSNPSNVMFRNESGEHARLVIELHPAVDADGVPLGPERLCTALVEDGGVAAAHRRVRPAELRRRGGVRVHRRRHRCRARGGRAVNPWATLTHESTDNTDADRFPPLPSPTALRRTLPSPVAAVVLSSCARTPRRTRGRPPASTPRTSTISSGRSSLIAGVVGVIVFGVDALRRRQVPDRGQPIPEQTPRQGLARVPVHRPPGGVARRRSPCRPSATVIALNDTDDADCVVNVTGQQWWWEYDYPVDADGNICGFAPTGRGRPDRHQRPDGHPDRAPRSSSAAPAAT